MRKLLVKLASAILGLWLAVRFVPDVDFTGTILALIITGFGLGILNWIIQPVLKLVLMPLRVLTLNLFTFVINAAIIWIATWFFPDLIINGLIPLMLTTLIIWLLGLALSLLLTKKKISNV